MGAGEGNVDELVDGVAKVGREAWELMTREDDIFCASNLFVYFWKRNKRLGIRLVCLGTVVARAQGEGRKWAYCEYRDEGRV